MNHASLKPNTFVVPKERLSGRFDAEYYTPERMKFVSALQNNPNLIKLKVAIAEGSYGVLPPGDCYSDVEPVSFFRATDLRPELLLFTEKNVRVPQEYYDSHKRARLQDGDILIAVKGATIASNKCIGFIESAPKNAIVNGSIFRFQTTDQFIPKYISLMLELPYVKQQMVYNLVANNAVDYLDRSLINNLMIYSCSVSEQLQFVSKLSGAYNAKKAKEAEAQMLLDSIDDYLLKELGIEQIGDVDNTLQSRIFIRPSSLLIGERWDAFYFKDKFVKLEEGVRNAKFPAVNLGAELLQIFNGFDDRDSYERGTPYLKVANIRPYEIGTTKEHNTQSDIPPRIKLQRNDILLTRKGSFGIAARVSEKSEGYAICSEIFKLRFSQRVDSLYVEAILNSTICQIQFDQLKIGAIMGSLTQDAVSKILIPLPPIDEQRKIAQHISGIRAEARLLRSEAAEYLGSVKADVEKMILGEA